MNWCGTQPANPVMGDCYFDQSENRGYIWQGSAWITFSGKDDENVQEFTPPTDEQLDKHPALKEAWEEFLVIKRLLGV